jgi:hypothetical protein
MSYSLDSIVYAIPTYSVSHVPSYFDVVIRQSYSGEVTTPTIYQEDVSNLYAEAFKDGGACRTMQHSPDPFLKPSRPYTQFIGDVERIAPLIKETFFHVTGEVLPDTIVLHLCSLSEMRKEHARLGGGWNDGIQGFSINGPIPQVFVKQESLDRVMVTMGHEIGHVISPSLGQPHEEAKAFAFEMAWVQALREHNIGGLAECIVDMVPASNGLHDQAFGFVLKLVKKGYTAFDVFWKLRRNEIVM